MDGYLKHQAAQFALEQLLKTPAGEKLQQALQLIQTMQKHLAALSAKEEASSVTGVKGSNGPDHCCMEENCKWEKSFFLRC